MGNEHVRAMVASLLTTWLARHPSEPDFGDHWLLSALRARGIGDAGSWNRESRHKLVEDGSR